MIVSSMPNSPPLMRVCNRPQCSWAAVFVSNLPTPTGRWQEGSSPFSFKANILISSCVHSNYPQDMDGALHTLCRIQGTAARPSNAQPLVRVMYTRSGLMASLHAYNVSVSATACRIHSHTRSRLHSLSTDGSQHGRPYQPAGCDAMIRKLQEELAGLEEKAAKLVQERGALKSQ